MDILNYIKIGEAIVVTISVVGAGLLWQTIRTYKENNEALKQRVEIVEGETKDCHKQHASNLERIKYLEGQLDIYQSLPLKDWAESQKKLAKKISEISRTDVQKFKILKEILIIVKENKDESRSV